MKLSCNKPLRPKWLCDVETITFSRQSAHRWQCGCQPSAPTVLYTPWRFLVLISVRGWVDLRVIMRLEGLRKLKKSSYLIRNTIRDLPTCSKVPQAATLPRAPWNGALNFISFAASFSDDSSLGYGFEFAMPRIRKKEWWPIKHDVR
jgi:hypothetical protein